MNILVPFGVAAIILLLTTLELVRVRRLKERYAAIWVGFAAAMLGGVAFPEVAARISHFLGFQVPATLVISIGIFVLALVALQLSVDITRLHEKTDQITSRLAIIELELRHGPARDEDLTGDDS